MGALAGLSSAIGAAGDLDHAETVARSIAEPAQQAKALADLAVVAKDGDARAARRLIGLALCTSHWSDSVHALAVVDPAALAVMAASMVERLTGD